MKEILYNRFRSKNDQVEQYILRQNLLEENDLDREGDREIIVKSMEMSYNGEECQVLNFTDITSYKRLKREEETNRLLKILMTSISHEIIGPLKTNVQISACLIKALKEQNKLKEMVETILISSQLVMHHATDLLDQRIIQLGQFVPYYTQGSPSEAITDIVKIVRMTLLRKQLSIEYD